MGKINCRFSPNLELTDSLDGAHACAYIGTSVKTLKRLRDRGLISAFWLPSEASDKKIWRYRVLDLHSFTKQRENRKRAWIFAEKEEMPGSVAASILGLDVDSLYVARSRGHLKDYTPQSVRSFLRNRMRRELKSELKAQLRQLRRRVKHLELLLDKLRANPGAIQK